MFTLPFEEQLIRRPSGDSRTPLVYRGGKTSLASWVISYFPPCNTLVDVFGGGGGVSFAGVNPPVHVYNDKGRVSKFFKILRDNGEELYRKLYLTPYSREEFYNCKEAEKNLWYGVLESEFNDPPYEPGYYEITRIEWARCWYVGITQSYRHEEQDDSWLMAKGVNTASVNASHVDDLPKIIDKLRTMIIEMKDFRDIIKGYDTKDTLFYCDPPYLPGTWDDTNGYVDTMSEKDHIEFLELVNKVQGQVVVSGYPSKLYDRYLKGWKRVEKTRMGGMHNSSQKASPRTEVLWIRSHHEGLWTGQQEQGISSPYISRMDTPGADLEAIRVFRERNHIR